MLEVTLGFSWSPTTSSSLPHKSIDVEVFELPVSLASKRRYKLKLWMLSLLLLQEFSRYLGQQFPHPLRLPGLLSWSWSYNHLLPGSEILAGRAGEVLRWHFPEECWAVALYWARYMEKVDSRGRHKLKWMINLKFIHLSILSLNTLLWSAPKMCPDHCASLGMQQWTR